MVSSLIKVYGFFFDFIAFLEVCYPVCTLLVNMNIELGWLVIIVIIIDSIICHSSFSGLRPLFMFNVSLYINES